MSVILDVKASNERPAGETLFIITMEDSYINLIEPKRGGGTYAPQMENHDNCSLELKITH